jgi:hypothetical protein
LEGDEGRLEGAADAEAGDCDDYGNDGWVGCGVEEEC